MDAVNENVLPTQSFGPGSFTKLDLQQVPSPCFVVDEVKLRANLELLAEVGRASGAKVLSALKAFSMWRFAPLVSEYLDGVCTSGLWEARLAQKHYQASAQASAKNFEITTYCAAYKAQDIEEIKQLSEHIIFNSPEALQRFGTQVKNSCSIGLRLNPLHREGLVAKYDPCAPGSRLGTPVTRLAEVFETPELAQLVDGIHIHTLCEQDLLPLIRTWQALKPHLSPYFKHLKWINLGGGHHITRPDYDRSGLIRFLKDLAQETECQIYIEPGEAVALDAGILVGEVLDVTYTPEHDPKGAYQVILDISATCHMPDVIEAPYRPALMHEVSAEARQAGEAFIWARFGGPSCLAGDQIGVYALAQVPNIGDRVAFLDQAHYSMVKTNTFNGVPLPSIALWSSQTQELELVKSFTWESFEERLS